MSHSPRTENGRYIVFLFHAVDFTGEVRASEEGAMHWIHKDELPALCTVEDLRELIEVILRQDLTEFQYVVEEQEWKVVVK